MTAMTIVAASYVCAVPGRYATSESTSLVVGHCFPHEGRWHYLYRGVDLGGQVLDCWLSRTRDLAADEAFFRPTISSTGYTPEHVVADKATFCLSAIGSPAPGARHTGTAPTTWSSRPMAANGMPPRQYRADNAQR